MSSGRVHIGFLDVFRALRRILASGRKSALRIVFHRIRQEWFAEPDDFDQHFGVETRLTVWRKRITSKPDSTDYQAVNPYLFARAIAQVPLATFIDLGCGKGRALILAHEAGFRDLIGVEISPALVRAAVQNLRQLEIAASIVQSDVANFRLPEREVVIFLYNPFGPPTMQLVAEKLRSHMHPVHVIYVNPVHAALFSDFRAFYADDAVAVLTSRGNADEVRLPTGT